MWNGQGSLGSDGREVLQEPPYRGAGQVLHAGQSEKRLGNNCVPREKPGTSRAVLLGREGAQCPGKGRTRADHRAHCVSEVVSSPFCR